jgi:hypothetical protein
VLRIALALALAAAPAVAQPAPAAEVAPLHDLGTYAGVEPGGTQPPPAERRLRRRRPRVPTVLTWPGFRPLPGGGSRFFLQMTEAVQPEVSVQSDRVELRFPRARVHLRNSRRWLETRFLNTPVLRARLERRGRDLVFVMRLREAAVPDVGPPTPAPNGAFHYLFVDFPPGEYVPGAPPPGLGAERSLQPEAAPPRDADRPAVPRPAPPRPEDPELNRMDDEAPPPVQLD